MYVDIFKGTDSIAGRDVVLVIAYIGAVTCSPYPWNVCLLCLQSQLGAAPVTTLGIPLDTIVSSRPDPVRQRSVLSLLLGKRSLGSESFLGRLWGRETTEKYC